MCQENTNDEHDLELTPEQQELEDKLVKRLFAPYVPPDQRPANQEEEEDEEGPYSDFDL